MQMLESAIHEETSKRLMSILRCPDCSNQLRTVCSHCDSSRLATLETELQQLRLAADGMRDAIEALMSSSGSNIVEASDELLREAAALVHDTDAAQAAKAFLAARQALAAYRAAGEGKDL